MWVIRDNYGDRPAPRRYFLREEPAEQETAEDQPDLDWKSFSVILMRALLPFPEAKAAVLAAFGDVSVCPAPP
jgi:hypothetical protein